MKKAFLITALALSTAAHAADNTTVATVNGESTPALSGALQQANLPDLPTQIEFKSLDKSWRRFTANVDSKTNNPYGSTWGPYYETVLQEMGIGVHFTKGENLSIGKESYLIAYRVDPGMEPQELQQEIQNRMQQFWGHGHGAQPVRRPAGKFSPRATLKLALLNLRSMGDLRDLRAFNPERDLLSPTDLRTISNDNLRRIGQWLNQYQNQQWSGNQGLPLRDARALRTMLQNFFHAGGGVLRDPATNQNYQVNALLAGKRANRIGNKKALPAVYEIAPSSDGTRGVLFLDGHVERVPEWKWKTVRTTKIQAPSARDWRVLSNNQLRTIGGYVRGFAQWRRSEGKLPDTTSFQTVRQSLMNRYGWNTALYQHPQTGLTYRFNPAIAKRKLADISNTQNVVLAFEGAPSSDGTRGAVFLDGKVRRIPETRWKTTLAVKPVMNKKTGNNGSPENAPRTVFRRAPNVIVN